MSSLWLRWQKFILLLLFTLILFLVATVKASAPLCRNVFLKKMVQTQSGASFEYIEILSQSGRSIIYRLPGNRILRLSKSDNPEQDIVNFVKGYELLKDAGVKDMAHIQPRGLDWIIQDYIKVDMTLENFLLRMEAILIAKPDQFKMMVRGLNNFAEQTANLATIGDFHSGQLVWNGKKWKLLDWNHESRIANKPLSDTIFNGFEKPSELAAQVIEGLKSSIHEHRSHNRD